MLFYNKKGAYMLNKFYFSVLFGLAITLTACGDDDSSGVSGSFPDGGDPKFYCEVTDGTDSDGTIWVQFKLNIPNRMGKIEKSSIDKNGTEKGYYEESYYSLNSKEESMMCREMKKYIQGNEYITDFECGNGVAYIHYEMTGVRKKNLDSTKEDFEKECEDYQSDWEDGYLD